MTFRAHPTGRSTGADIVATDRDGRAALIVESKAMTDAGEIGIASALERFNSSDAPFVMFADLDEMVLFRKGLEDPASPALRLKTRDVLIPYEPDFDDKRISEDYFSALIEAWLRDYAFHWRFERPPAYEEMQAVGLVGRLEGGMAAREMDLGDLPLY